MGWFSKPDEGFFLATIVPDGEAAHIAKVLDEAIGMMIVAVSGTAVKMG